MLYKKNMLSSMLVCCLAVGCLLSGCNSRSVDELSDDTAGISSSTESLAESNNKGEESSAAEEDTPAVTMYFFHDTACGSCNGTEDFYNIYEEQLKDIDKEKYPAEVHTYNIFQTSGREKMEEIAQEWGLDPASISDSALLINGRVFSGLEAIEKNLKEQYLIACEKDPVDASVYRKDNLMQPEQLFEGWDAHPENQTVVYFYRITCPECNETKPVIDALPDSVEVDGQSIPVDLVRINTREGRNGDRIQEFFKAYDVPQEDQMVPIVFLKDQYLAGYDEISGSLVDLLEQGAGLEFSWPQPQQ